MLGLSARIIQRTYVTEVVVGSGLCPLDAECCDADWTIGILTLDGTAPSKLQGRAQVVV